MRCANSKGYFQYYQGKKYLNKYQKNYIKQLAQKEYCMDIKTEVNKRRKKLEELAEIYREEKIVQIYEQYPLARKAIVTPFIKPIEEITKEFEEMRYKGKEFDEQDMTEYYTSKGERVRSKSEKIIADELFRNRIPYKYEMPLEVINWNKRVIVYPDFTVLNKRTGRKWIIEHFGIMDNPDYYENVMFKLDTYEKNDILLGKNLLIFHETSSNPLNTKVMQKYMEIYLK